METNPDAPPITAHVPVAGAALITTAAPAKDVAPRGLETTALNEAGDMAPDKVLEHLWRFFALHAQQRISVFNFFVVLSGVLATAIGGGIQAGRPMAILVMVLGCLLALISFIFFKLDQRGSDLVKLSEYKLRNAEAACLPEYARIFDREPAIARGEVSSSEPIFQTKWTFRTSFRLLLAVMSMYGLGASAFSVYRLLTESSAKVESAAGTGGATMGWTPKIEPSSKAVSDSGAAQALKPTSTTTFDQAHPGTETAKPNAAPNKK